MRRAKSISGMRGRTGTGSMVWGFAGGPFGPAVDSPDTLPVPQGMGIRRRQVWFPLLTTIEVDCQCAAAPGTRAVFAFAFKGSNGLPVGPGLRLGGILVGHCDRPVKHLKVGANCFSGLF